MLKINLEFLLSDLLLASFLGDLLSKGLDSSRYVTNLRKETTFFKKHAFQLTTRYVGK